MIKRLKYFYIPFISLLINGNLFSQDLSRILPLAEKGNPEAQYMLSLMYCSGEGLPHDESLCVNWMKKSARNGHPGAQHDLGRIYGSGQWIEKSVLESFYWMEKAAIQEHPEAQYRLGVYYLKGIGCKKNADKANYWAVRGVLNGFEDELGLMEFKGYVLINKPLGVLINYYELFRNKIEVKNFVGKYYFERLYEFHNRHDITSAEAEELDYQDFITNDVKGYVIAPDGYNMITSHYPGITIFTISINFKIEYNQKESIDFNNTLTIALVRNESKIISIGKATDHEELYNSIVGWLKENTSTKH